MDLEERVFRVEWSTGCLALSQEVAGATGVGTDTLSDLKIPKSDIFKLKNGGGLVL